ncbi:hypothetical protein B0H16DRAFT_1480169 [Mycena metata]|uniref:Uncharacterized protein n=1 Tax=Mycena metata TaxID=1033252 RepID=A0AAD7MDG2_9AGAR|nr:hypothetical protein B0H16DRAFT_1480169 [Mycena metata]
MHRSETAAVAKREKCRQHVTLPPCTAANIAASDANIAASDASIAASTAASTAANIAADFAATATLPPTLPPPQTLPPTLPPLNTSNQLQVLQVFKTKNQHFKWLNLTRPRLSQAPHNRSPACLTSESAATELPPKCRQHCRQLPPWRQWRHFGGTFPLPPPTALWSLKPAPKG